MQSLANPSAHARWWGIPGKLLTLNSCQRKTQVFHWNEAHGRIFRLSSFQSYMQQKQPIKKWSPRFGWLNRNALGELSDSSPRQWPTSLIPFWLNRNKSLQPRYRNLGKSIRSVCTSTYIWSCSVKLLLPSTSQCRMLTLHNICISVKGFRKSAPFWWYQILK